MEKMKKKVNGTRSVHRVKAHSGKMIQLTLQPKRKTKSQIPSDQSSVASNLPKMLTMEQKIGCQNVGLDSVSNMVQFALV